MHPLLQLPQPLPVTPLLMHAAAWQLSELLYMLFDMVLMMKAPA